MIRTTEKRIVANKVIFNFMKSDPSWPLFVKNVKEQNSESPKRAFKYLLGAYGAGNYNRALVWMATPEGHSYWAKRHNALYTWAREHSELVNSNYKYL